MALHKPNFLAVLRVLSACTIWLQVALGASSGHAASPPPCTKTIQPGQSIQTFLYKAVAGDVICVRPGTYHEALSLGASGTPDAPIIVRGDGGRPVLDGEYQLPKENGMDYSKPRLGCPGVIDGKLPDGTPSKMRFECSGYIPLVRIAGSNVVFEGFEVTRSSGSGITAVAKTQRTNVTIRNNLVHSVRDAGILLWQVDRSTVEHNEVFDAQNFAPFWRDGFALVWGAGVGAYASHDIAFRANIIHDNWGDALLVDINKGGSSTVLVENNILYQNYASNGIYAHAVKHLSMHRNLMYCATANTMPIASSLLIAPTERQYSEEINAEDISVTHNVFAECPKAAVVLWNTKLPRQIVNVTFANNTIYNDGKAISLRSSGGEFLKDVRVQKNLVVKTTFDDAGLISSDNRVTNSTVDAGLSGVDGRGTFPEVIKPGEMKPEWFKQSRYGGVGADISGFIRAGLIRN